MQLMPRLQHFSVQGWSTPTSLELGGRHICFCILSVRQYIEFVTSLSFKDLHQGTLFLLLHIRIHSLIKYV